MKSIFIVGFLISTATAYAQMSSSSSGELGKCQDIFSAGCETLYGTYSAMDASKLEQRFMGQDTSMTFDELSILQKAYSENRIKGFFVKKAGSVGSGAGEALVTFTRTCCLYNNFKTYGQFLNFIKTPVYGQADCAASQAGTVKDKAVEASQAAQIGM
jgi:hypothetical protein